MTLPTPHPDVNEALQAINALAMDVLGENFVGLYAYGSLALGNFDPALSDIDLLVVCREAIDEDTLAKLEEAHIRLNSAEDEWTKEAEVYYVPQAALQTYDRNHPPRPRFHSGRMMQAWQGPDWVLHRHVLREKGIAVSGPDIKPMIAPVSVQEIREAVSIGILHDWWEEKVLPQQYRMDEPLYLANAVLAMCRCLCTLETGEVVSKKAAAKWTRERVEAPVQSLIDCATAWRPDMPMEGKDEVIAFVEDTIRQSMKYRD